MGHPKTSLDTPFKEEGGIVGTNGQFDRRGHSPRSAGKTGKGRDATTRQVCCCHKREEFERGKKESDTPLKKAKRNLSLEGEHEVHREKAGTLAPRPIGEEDKRKKI